MYTKKERTAIARIVSDMIKSDNIIEQSEIRLLDHLKQTYNLSDVLCAAREIPFSRALNDLAKLSVDDKISLYRDIAALSSSDGACVPREALLLLALRYVLGIEQSEDDPSSLSVRDKSNVQVISCPTGDMSISSQYVIYIEGKYDTQVNDQINSQLELFVLKLRSLGFDFIYIPALVQEFKHMDANYVKSAVGYMAPELPSAQIDRMYDRLIHMDTLTFCNYVLADKLHIDSLKNATPSLFINIGTSIVPYTRSEGSVQCYTEFLCLPIDGQITSLINTFVQDYSSLVSHNPIAFAPIAHQNRFKYFGFYKALFDFLVRAEPIESDLVLCPSNSYFSFPQLPDTQLRLAPQEAAIYKLILHFTYNHPSHGLPSSFSSVSDKKSVYSTYRLIYGNENAAYPDIDPICSRIKKKIQKQLSSLSNLSDFIPQKIDGKYIISAHKERILISDSHDTKRSRPRSFLGYNWSQKS